jgi:hypothetical protein
MSQDIFFSVFIVNLNVLPQARPVGTLVIVYCVDGRSRKRDVQRCGL